jgi:hypothetical protein
VAAVRSLDIQEYAEVEVNAGLIPVTVAFPPDNVTFPITI